MGRGPSTASQTAWGVMGLLAYRPAEDAAVRRGIAWLVERQLAGAPTAGSWDEEAFTGTGFPRHFYLRYHLYRHYFPLMALGRFCARRRRERMALAGIARAALGDGRPPAVRLGVLRLLPRVRGAPARLAEDAHVRGRDLAPRVRRRVQLDPQRLPVRPVPYFDETRTRELWISNVPFWDSLSFVFLSYFSLALAAALLSPAAERARGLWPGLRAPGGAARRRRRS